MNLDLIQIVLVLVAEHEDTVRLELRHVLQQLVALLVQLGLARVNVLGLLLVDLSEESLEHGDDEVQAEDELEEHLDEVHDPNQVQVDSAEY